MSYLYTAPGSAATAPAANAYPHSPYAGSQASAAPPRSPYMGAGQQQGPVYPQQQGSVYSHSPYSGTTGSTLVASAPGAYPTQAMQPSPMAGQIYLPPGGQLTVGQTATVPGTPSQATQPFTANVTPGSVTYTTTTDALGRITYHHFRAEPASYRSPQGVTYSGIQWVPTETSSVPPVGVAPAGPDVLASFRGQIPTVPGSNVQGQAPLAGNQGLGDYREDDREWEREERRRKKEEKAAMKRSAAWEAERIAREKAEKKEMRRAREREAEVRPGRTIYGTGLGAGLNSGAYNREPSRERGDTLREREMREREERELERGMGGLDIGGRGGMYGPGDYGPPPTGTRSRRQSMSARASGGIYEDPTYDRDNEEYGGTRKRDQSRRRSVIYTDPEQPLDPYGASQRSRPASIYGGNRAASRPSSMYAPERSPYRRDATPLQPILGPGGVEVYPPGHILAGQPVSSTGFSASRHQSPNIGAGAYPGGLGGPSPRIGGGMLPSRSPRVGPGPMPGLSPRMGGGVPLAGAGAYAPQPQDLLTTPEAFNRPINKAQTFTPFKDLRVQDMDELLDGVFHPMPAILGTHDVLPEDWGRLMHDITLAWNNRLPLPADKPTRKSDLVIDLLDLWNTMFFYPRFVELVLYKGRNARSGPDAGMPEARLSSEQLLSPEEISDSEDESDDGSEEEYADQYGYSHGHGRRGQSQKREQAKSLRRKQKLEAKVQREMELNKRYTLWLRYVEPREGY